MRGFIIINIDEKCFNEKTRYSVNDTEILCNKCCNNIIFVLYDVNFEAVVNTAVDSDHCVKQKTIAHLLHFLLIKFKQKMPAVQHNKAIKQVV